MKMKFEYQLWEQELFPKTALEKKVERGNLLDLEHRMTERTNWSYQTLSKPHMKKNTVEVLDSNNCFKCTKNKHFRKRNPTYNKYHWNTKRSRVDEGRERNQKVDKKKINSIFNCQTDCWSIGGDALHRAYWQSK